MPSARSKAKSKQDRQPTEHKEAVVPQGMADTLPRTVARMIETLAKNVAVHVHQKERAQLRQNSHGDRQSTQ